VSRSRIATDLRDVVRADPEGMKVLLLSANGSPPNRVGALVVALECERNLFHVDAWERFTVETAAESDVAAAEPQLAPA
jgi:hypothetical protein